MVLKGFAMPNLRNPTARVSVVHRRGRGATWRHPDDPGILVSRQCATVIALMQMGVSDYGLIAKAVGLEVGVIEQIDTAEDRVIRALAVAGIPRGEFFKLRVHVHCPRCHGRVYTAPCAMCAQNNIR
jgi:hypothetical protein